LVEKGEPCLPCPLEKYSYGTKKGWEGKSQPKEEEMKGMFISQVNSEYQIAREFKYHEGCILRLQKLYFSNH